MEYMEKELRRLIKMMKENTATDESSVIAELYKSFWRYRFKQSEDAVEWCVPKDCKNAWVVLVHSGGSDIPGSASDADEGQRIIF